MTYEEYAKIENEIESDKPLTISKALGILKKLADDNDFETTHYLADKVLINLINDEQIEEAYYNVGKWYA